MGRIGECIVRSLLFLTELYGRQSYSDATLEFQTNGNSLRLLQL